MFRIAVAGTGYVGLVAGVCFAEVGHTVTCVDIDEQKISLLQSGVSPIYEAGLETMLQRNIASGRLRFTTDYASAYRQADTIFIGVGTPEQPDGSANLTYIAAVARQIAESIEKDCLVVVKSTVPVGTNDKVERFLRDFLPIRKLRPGQGKPIRVEVASNPEFLAQGTAVRDTMSAARVVIGTASKWAEEILMKIYEPFHLPVVSVSRRSAEMIKYASNDFLALKISYINDIANLCELAGADIQDVVSGMGYDGRIGRQYLSPGIGYGGSCFPKDTKALDYLAKQHGYQLRTVKAAIDVNTDQKTALFRKARNRLITFLGLKVAVLGLTFKGGTDDLREAASLENIPLLLEQGASICAYDPAGMGNFRKLYSEGNTGKGSIRYAKSPEDALEEANVCFVFTDWDEFKALEPGVFQRLMHTPLVFDGRNLYGTREMADSGVEYYSIGRPAPEMKKGTEYDLRNRYDLPHYRSGRVRRVSPGKAAAGVRLPGDWC